MTQSYDKSPYTNRKLKNQRDNEKTAKMFDYTAIADKLKTVSWSIYFHRLVWLFGLRIQPSH